MMSCGYSGKLFSEILAIMTYQIMILLYQQYCLYLLSDYQSQTLLSTKYYFGAKVISL